MAEERSTTQRLFDALVERGHVTAEQLAHAQEVHAQTRQPLGEVLVARGLVTPGEVRQVLEEDLGIPTVDLASYAPEPAALRLVPIQTARATRLLPLFEIEGMLTVAVANPLDVFGFDELSAQLAYELEPVLSDPSEIAAAIESNYVPDGGEEGTPTVAVEEAVGEAGAVAGAPLAEEGEAPATVAEPRPAPAKVPSGPAVGTGGPIDLDVLAVADSTTIVMLIADILTGAVDDGASHVHVDPGPEEFELVFRVEGERRRIGSAAIGFESALSRTIRSMAHVAEGPGAPAAGRMKVLVRDEEITVGVSFLPTTHGERVVMVLPAVVTGPSRLDETGMGAEDRAALEGVLTIGRGLVAVAGPIHGGRSTTYDILLAGQAARGRTVISIEDRFDIDTPGVWQVELTLGTGMDSAAALAVAERQDTDVIGVDELRRADDMHRLLESIAAGRLGICTAVGADGCDTIARWIGMGVEAESLAASVAAVVSQRVVVRNCPACRTQYTSDLAGDLEVTGQVASFKGSGCTQCDQTGQAGHIGIFEVLVAGDALRHAIAKGSGANELRQVAARAGTRTLLENGYLQVAAGELTLEELNRAVPFAHA